MVVTCACGDIGRAVGLCWEKGMDEYGVATLCWTLSRGYFELEKAWMSTELDFVSWLLRVGSCWRRAWISTAWLLRVGLCLVATSSWLLRVGRGYFVLDFVAWLLRVGESMDE